MGFVYPVAPGRFFHSPFFLGDAGRQAAFCIFQGGGLHGKMQAGAQEGKNSQSKVRLTVDQPDKITA